MAIKDHQSELCPFRLKKCPYASAGCEATEIAQNLSNHMSLCSFKPSLHVKEDNRSRLPDKEKCAYCR